MHLNNYSSTPNKRTKKCSFPTTPDFSRLVRLPHYCDGKCFATGNANDTFVSQVRDRLETILRTVGRLTHAQHARSACCRAYAHFEGYRLLRRPLLK